jgi:fluoroquinolone transport system permease protein
VKPITASFGMLVRQITKDGMLIVVSFASILAGFFFRFAIPVLEGIVCAYFKKPFILAPYYRLFDLILTLLPPYMLCFATAMVMLDEYDQNMTGYLAVTPLCKRGYIVSHLVMPACLSVVVAFILVSLFHLSIWDVPTLIVASFLAGVSGFTVALFVFAFSRNKVEGMAMAKLSGLILCGLPVPFFMHSNWQYLFSPLPSYWVARFCLDGNVVFFMVALGLSLAYLPWFYGKVIMKII